METADLIELGTLLGIIVTAVGAFFKVQQSQKSSNDEIDRLRKLVEGSEGDGGLKRRINLAEQELKLMTGIKKEVQDIKKQQTVILQILQKLAAKEGIEIPYFD